MKTYILFFLFFRNQTKSCYSIPLFMTYSDQVHNISCSIQNKDFPSTTCIASHFVRPRLRLLLSTLHFQYNVKHTRVQVLNAKCFRALLRIILWFSKHCNDFAWQHKFSHQCQNSDPYRIRLYSLAVQHHIKMTVQPTPIFCKSLLTVLD